ncbi:YciI family protein [Agromyces sp. SYSU T0242]|uniref:YciI family protein n=1 Tax=Agromyces litoreus TaxID=3158561 RepID=UPI0033915344
MEYALLYADGADPVPYAPDADDIGDWVDDVVSRGVSEYGERLRPGQDATTLRVRSGEVLVTDGPFSEAKETIGGFDVIDVRDLDEAIEIASRHPVAWFGRVEIRPFLRRRDPAPRSGIVPVEFHDRPERGRRYLLLVVAERPDADPHADPQVDAAGSAWASEMETRGVRLFGAALHRPADATFVRRRHGEVLVSDRGDAPTDAWLAGVDLIEVRDLAEAIEVAAAHPMAARGSIELRPTWPLDAHEDHVARDEREAPDRDRRIEPRSRDAIAEARR